MRKFKKIVLCLCMSLLLVSNLSINVFASELNDGVNDGFDRFMGGHNIEGFNTWEATDKKSFMFTNIGSFFAELGLYIKGDSNDSLIDIFVNHLIESGRIEDADSTAEYLSSHLTANDEETEIYMSNDLTDALHETAVKYIEQETGFRTHLTLDSTEYLRVNVDKFTTAEQYNAYLDYCKTHPSTVFYGNMKTGSYNVTDSDGNTVSYDGCFTFYEIDIRETDFTWTYSYMNGWQQRFYDKNWTEIPLKQYIVTKDGQVIYRMTGTVIGKYTLHGYLNYSSYSAEPLYLYYSYESIKNIASGYTPRVIDITFNSSYFLHSYNPQNLRLYDSLADLKNYGIGNRPYVAGEQFYNYDSSVDNSTTITQTTLDNSITYGDVYNYITNNYDNPDGLTESQLMDILAEYLAQNSGNNSGSGGGSASGNNSGSGGGLGGLLDGLGSFGNVILSILGKLVEIIGQAIELITGGILDIITIVPDSVTQLLTAIFPVFPEEWVKAITLSLILGVVLGIIRMFK